MSARDSQIPRGRLSAGHPERNRGRSTSRFVLGVEDVIEIRLFMEHSVVDMYRREEQRPGISRPKREGHRVNVDVFT